MQKLSKRLRKYDNSFYNCCLYSHLINKKKKNKKKKKCIGDKFLCTLNTSVQYDGSHFYWHLQFAKVAFFTLQKKRKRKKRVLVQLFVLKLGLNQSFHSSRVTERLRCHRCQQKACPFGRNINIKMSFLFFHILTFDLFHLL